MEIVGADCFCACKDLKLRLKMGQVTNMWGVPYGYDHVYLHIFSDFGFGSRQADLPVIRYSHPGFGFNVGALLYGEGAFLYKAQVSPNTPYGEAIAAPVELAADTEAGTIEVYFPRYLFRELGSLQGGKVLITTWDGDKGELREIEKKPSDWAFSLNPEETSEATDLDIIPRWYNWVEFTL